MSSAAYYPLCQCGLLTIELECQVRAEKCSDSGQVGGFSWMGGGVVAVVSELWALPQCSVTRLLTSSVCCGRWSRWRTRHHSQRGEKKTFQWGGGDSLSEARCSAGWFLICGSQQLQWILMETQSHSKKIYQNLRRNFSDLNPLVCSVCTPTDLNTPLPQSSATWLKLGVGFRYSYFQM